MRSNGDPDRAVDRLLGGERSAALADLAPAITTLRALAVAPDGRDAVRIGAALARVAADSRTPLSREPAAATSPWVARAGAVATLGILVAGTFTGAAAADPSAPGDVLYGLDRALERIGVRDGGAGERIAEAQVLDLRGDYAGALAHVVGVAPDGSDSSAALLAAAQDLREHASELTDDVRSSVDELLAWMEGADFSAPDFEDVLAERTRDLPPAASAAAPRTNPADHKAPQGDAPNVDAVARDARTPAERAGTEDRHDAPRESEPSRDAERGHGRSDDDRDSRSWRSEDPRAGADRGDRWSNDGSRDGRDREEWHDRRRAGQHDEGVRERDSRDGSFDDVGASPVPDRKSGSYQAVSPSRP